MKWHLVVGLLFLGVSGLAVGGERFYGADLQEAQWATRSSRLECALSQRIPAYGTATFSRRAGEELRFTVQVMHESTSPQRARLNSAPPAWRHDAVLRDLGQVAVGVGRVPFNFERALSLRLLAELEHGMFPTLIYRDWADGRDEVQVTLSAVNFRNALDDFLACLDGLLPYDFNTVKFTNLHFPLGGVELDGQHARRLDQLAEYLLADDSVKQVEIDGYTDSIGFRVLNRDIGQRRAEAVRDYLVAKGASAELFRVRSHGENNARYNNRTERGRSLNRRATVTLLK